MTIRNFLFTTLGFLLLAACASAQIKSGKAIHITISGVPAEEKARFDVMYPVSDRGMVNMPFIGKVQAAGLKAEDLATLLQQKYKQAQIYTNPTFQVIDSDAKTIDQQLVIVGGFVRRPGPTPFFDRMTLWQAIQAAGGANEFGSMNRVELTRNGNVTKYDCTESENQQVRLRPGDAINVPQKNWIGN
ncbi:MAG: polysaccharide biosynthesis/export family protein [Luteolibacter sp.]